MFQNYNQLKSFIIYSLFLGLCIFSTDTFAQPCYAIAVDDVENDIRSHLVEFDIEKRYTKHIAALDANIKAIAINPISGKIYTARFNEFGTLNPVTGKFEKVNNLGAMNGTYGILMPDSIRAMAFNPLDGIIYAVEYNFGSLGFTNPGHVPGSEDLLFKINPATGNIIKNSMHKESVSQEIIETDYAVIEVAETGTLGLPTMRDVWDISIHPNTGELLAYHRVGYEAVLSILNAETGQIDQFLMDLCSHDVLGISFSRDGHSVYFTSGSSFDQNPNILVERFFEGFYVGGRGYGGLIDAENYFFKSIDCSLPQYLPYQPCKFELELTNMMDHQTAYEAEGIINSNLYINDDTEFYAGTSINLFSGFEVKTNTDFAAYISSCD